MTDTATCVACDHHSTTPPQLICTTCRGYLARNLRELTTSYRRLNPTPGAAPSNGGRGAPGFGSRSPARDDVLVLTDHRRIHTSRTTALLAASERLENVRQARSVPRELAGWADRAREVGALPARRVAASWAREDWPPRLAELVHAALVEQSRRDVDTEAAALLAHLDDVAALWWIGDLVDAVSGLLWHVRRALGELEPTVPLGACPIVPDAAAALWEQLWTDLPPQLAQHAAAQLACGGQIRARVWGEQARCARCTATWRTVEQLRELGALLGDALLDLPGLSRYLGVPVSTLTTWAHRNEWTKHGARGRRLYSLVEARATYADRRLKRAAVAA